MEILRGCLSYLALVSLAYCLGPNDSGCIVIQGNESTEIRCESSNSSFVILFERTNQNIQSLSITCEGALNSSNLLQGRILTPQISKNLNFESCQLPERKQIDFIKRHSSVQNVELISLNFLNMEVALNLSRSILQDLKGVKTLYISGNNFTDVYSDYLEGFPNLENLLLKWNIRGELLKYLSKLTNLQVLTLRNNDIEVIDSNTFGKLTKIHLLTISEGNLYQIGPNSFDEMVSLEKIEIIDCGQLRILPSNWIVNQRNLEFLELRNSNISHNSLTSDILRNHSGLVDLKFYNNKQNIITLPNKFLANMTNLKQVIMTDNGLVTLPEDLLLGTINLQYLDMANNNIKSLPPKFFRDCRELLSINFQSNQIDALPKNIFRSQSELMSLDLSYNRITTISSYEFSGLFGLEVLNMEGNNLEIIEDIIFFTQLRFANFSHNYLTLEKISMNKKTYFGFYFIEELDFSHNKISHILPEWQSCDKLRHLHLQHNNFERISEAELQFQSNNLRIDLRYNKIKEIALKNGEEQSIENSKKVYIDVGNNPIQCDCKVYDFLVYLERERYLSILNFFQFDVISLKCREPSSLNNRSLLSLKSEELTCLIDGPKTINTTCPEKCECWRRPSNRAYIIDCSSRGFDRAPEKIEGPAEYQLELNLTNNSLTIMPSLYQPGYEKITVLMLAYNNITEVRRQSLSTNLRILELHNNKISKIDNSILQYLKSCESLIDLTLHNNLWECNCELMRFIQEMSVKLPNLHNVTCGEKMKRKIFSLSSYDLCPDNALAFISIGIALIGIIIGGLIAMFYRFQQEIKIWLYARQWCLGWVTEDEIRKNERYDAFISYSHEDEDFVVNELIAKLEQGPKPIKLCIHYRDWLVGDSIADQVARSVKNSKRTVIILSANFIHSEWGRMEFHAAHAQALSDGRKRVIVIIYGEIPPIGDLDSTLQVYLNMNTYVKWGDPYFWDKLRYALPHNS